MQALNHVAFGTLIAVTIKQPALVAPLALASHFALDTFPHYGEDPRVRIGTAIYNYRIAADGIVSLILLISMILWFPSLYWIILLSTFLAVLPDFLWPIGLHIEQHGPLWQFFRFHKNIQKFESPRGIYFEIFWLTVILVTLQAAHSSF